ncbi:MAG TPA: filamentous hemagglutinin N-terminal domain-containing protein, partial [Rhizomicrobium sp.]|nr:filamentous hemagglutinin N-terminal domain-containing protein [Rhizomicrobium sp.]
MVPAQNSGRECRVLAENSPRISFYRNTTALGICMLCAISLSARSAQAGGVLPTNGQYVAGQGSISSAGNQLTVNQASSHGIINWNSFSIGAGNQVQFNNGSGATLNRVTGGNLSQIDGALKATGSVYLINPQGIVIGPGGQVITNGSFVASTRDVSNNGFMSGGAFAASGSSSGSVVNQGVITSNTGDAILVGSTVRNSGVISAPNGTVGLAAGNEITLQPLGSDARIAISGGTGSVTNSGNIRAAQAELNAAGGNVYALVENNGGAISATGTQTINGHVWLLAGGTTSVSGTITARNANGSGGAIETSGHSLVLNHANVNAGRGGQWLVDPDDLDVDATAATIIDSSLNAGTSVTLRTTASGTSGPGTVNANGQGDINIQSAINWNTAATLTLDAYHGINITAPITVQANGKIVLTTNDGGTGGDLSFGLGASGFAGNIAFIGTEGSGQSLTINGAAYTLLYSMSELEGLNTYRVGDYALAKPLDASSVTNWVPIGYGNTTQSQFANLFEGLGNTISNLTVNAGPDGGGLFGVISGTVRDVGVVGGSVRGSSELGGLAGGLFAGKVDDAYSTATVTGTGGSIGGLIGVGGGPIANSYAAGSVTGTAGVGGLVGLFSGSLVLTNSFYDIDRVLINGTHAVTLGGMYDAQYQDWIAHNLTLKPANYFGAPDANGFYSVSSVQGFEDLLGFSESSSPKFKLTHNLDLSSAPSFFIPYFEGTLNGQGYTISNFSLGETSATSNLPFGLFGVLSGGMITNVGLVNASVSGNEFVGGLVGLSNDGAVSNASVTGTVSGTSFYVGG